MLSKTSVYEVFTHHSEKMSSAYGGFPQTPTGELPLDPAGGLPSFGPLIANPWKKSCGRPWSAIAHKDYTYAVMKTAKAYEQLFKTTKTIPKNINLGKFVLVVNTVWTVFIQPFNGVSYTQCWIEWRTVHALSFGFTIKGTQKTQCATQGQLSLPSLQGGKWVPASAGKAKAGMVHSVSGWTRGVQVKLWDHLRTRDIPERLRGVTTRRYTDPRLPLPYLNELFDRRERTLVLLCDPFVPIYWAFHYHVGPFHLREPPLLSPVLEFGVVCAGSDWSSCVSIS